MDKGRVRVFAVEVDPGVEQITALIEKFYDIDVKRVHLRARHSVDKDELLHELACAGIPKNYSEKNGKTLFILGGGEYHHLTHALTKLSGKDGYCVFDWDAHTDDYGRDVAGARLRHGQEISCGSFADLLAEDCGAKKVNYIGVTNEPQSGESGYTTPTDIENDGIADATRELVSMAEEKYAYATVDLDVLDEAENVRVNTYWERDGSLRLNDLLTSIKLVRQGKEIFAADITGYNSFEPHTGDNPYSAKEKLVTVKSCLSVCLIAGELMDFDTAGVRDVLDKVNLRIMHIDSLSVRPEYREPGRADFLERESRDAPKDYMELMELIS